MSLKNKTIQGIAWSSLDSFVNLGIQFIVGIILARLLTPKEFGLIGMLVFFIAISQSIIDSGFTQALIRKKNIKQRDYSTVFYFNLIIGTVIYTILFFSADSIAHFFKEPQLTNLLQVLGLEVIIVSFTIIHTAKLTREINFKLQTKITIIASVLSGAIGIGMAYMGYGVWSLVGKTLSMRLFVSILLWIWNRWLPTLEFDKESFKSMFSFGSKLMLSGLIDNIYRNIYNLIIGKFFSAQALGFYTRADQFKKLPAESINTIISRVSYPVLSQLQDDNVKLKDGYRQIIKSTMLVTFFLMLSMAAVAEPMIMVLIGEKWLPAVEYLQLLCFAGMLFPLHSLNLNILNVKGRSDLFLRLEIIKKLIAVPVIILGIYFGIRYLLIGMIVSSLVSYFLNSYYSGRLINYSTQEQIRDIAPLFLISAVSAGTVFGIGVLLSSGYFVILSIQIVTGLFTFVFLNELLKTEEYVFMKNTLVNLYKNHKAK
jgi:O-antigen/teichoic acid export membrane protein